MYKPVGPITATSWEAMEAAELLDPSAIESTEEESSIEESRDELPGDCPKPGRKRIIVGACMFAIVGAALVVFNHALGTNSATTEGAKPHSARTFAELFESDDMADAMSKEVLYTAKVDAHDMKTVGAPLKIQFKKDFHAAVAEYQQKGPFQARQLAAPLTDQSKMMVLSLLSKIHSPQARDLGAKVHQEMHQQKGKSPEELHQIILSKHGSLIERYAAELFPNFLTQGSLSSHDTTNLRQLSNSRQLSDPAVMHNVATGLAISGLTSSIIGSILTAIQLLTNPQFQPKIPQWVVASFAAIANVLGTSACVVSLTNKKQVISSIAMNTSSAKPLEKVGIDMGADFHVVFPGWLKCAVFQGITGLISIISLITEFLPGNINTLVGAPYDMSNNIDGDEELISKTPTTR